MQVFLFLYPSIRYFELKRVRGREGPCNYERLNEMIDERYRRADYSVAWMINGCEHSPHIPDKNNIAPFYDIRPGDLVLSTGYPERFGSEFRRAEAGYVMSQLPGGVVDFCLGGFHLKDCVARFARELEAYGLPVRIDPDVTDKFFKVVHLRHLGITITE